VTVVQLLNPRPSLRIRFEAKPLECQYTIFQRFPDSVTAWFVARMLVVLLVMGTTVLLVCLRLHVESASRSWPEIRRRLLLMQRSLRQSPMQLSRQRGEAGAVVYALASVTFILKVDSLVQRLLRPLRAQR
jgi:hypothetical protein